MLEQASNRRTFPVDRHAGMAIAGLAADGRSVVNHAMREANGYKCAAGCWVGSGVAEAGAEAGSCWWLRGDARGAAPGLAPPPAWRLPAALSCPSPPRPLPHCPRRSFYGDPIPGHVLAERLGSYVHNFNLYW